MHVRMYIHTHTHRKCWGCTRMHSHTHVRTYVRMYQPEAAAGGRTQIRVMIIMQARAIYNITCIFTCACAVFLKIMHGHLRFVLFLSYIYILDIYVYI